MLTGGAWNGHRQCESLPMPDDALGQTVCGVGTCWATTRASPRQALATCYFLRIDVEAPPTTSDPNERAQRTPAGALDLRPIEVLLARIEAQYHPEQVWLFGSRARGDARPESDWDLFVVVPDDTADDQLDLMFLWRLKKGCGVPADVIACRATEFRDALDTVNTLSYVVANEGVLIDDR